MPRNPRRDRLRHPLAIAISLAALAIDPGCGLGDDAPYSPSSASTISQAVVTVPVQTPTGIVVKGADVGTLPGALTVGDDGSARYEIPIDVAPGAQAPSLSLRYSSRSGNGFLGVGWSLSGLSAISRCGSTFGTDGINAAVHNDSRDNLCLDGIRLLQINPRARSEYHPYPDTFEKVVVDSSDSVGPISFTVYDHDGGTRTYGATADSRVDSNHDRWPNPDNPWRLRWLLSRSTDASGNYMTVTYDKTNPHHIVPHRIDYGGHAGTGAVADRSVIFNWEDRADTERSFQGGVELDVFWRLSGIDL